MSIFQSELFEQLESLEEHEASLCVHSLEEVLLYELLSIFESLFLKI